eukprot:NODE_1010_length_1763_cov_33.282380_g892_i0.p1 GENE.NODE_1010_length_1763_cov_33.282380_g892_i0~~NODE_1010_length_1763_cov_33.282380_g892_i0.p1  ORF type:complete len:448 (+),score=64.04 NODE_1010_length_1763_cov_33.282380_g892_i0:91-1434(+)
MLWSTFTILLLLFLQGSHAGDIEVDIIDSEALHAGSRALLCIWFKSCGTLYLISGANGCSASPLSSLYGCDDGRCVTVSFTVPSDAEAVTLCLLRNTSSQSTAEMKLLVHALDRSNAPSSFTRYLVITAAVVAAIITFIVVYCVCRRKRRTKYETSQTEPLGSVGRRNSPKRIPIREDSSEWLSDPTPAAATNPSAAGLRKPSMESSPEPLFSLKMQPSHFSGDRLSSSSSPAIRRLSAAMEKSSSWVDPLGDPSSLPPCVNSDLPGTAGISPQNASQMDEQWGSTLAGILQQLETTEQDVLPRNLVLTDLMDRPQPPPPPGSIGSGGSTETNMAELISSAPFFADGDLSELNRVCVTAADFDEVSQSYRLRSDANLNASSSSLAASSSSSSRPLTANRLAHGTEWFGAPSPGSLNNQEIVSTISEVPNRTSAGPFSSQKRVLPVSV